MESASNSAAKRTGDEKTGDEGTSDVTSARPVLEIRGLVRSFRAVRALDGVDLDVRAGERVGLVGSDGAGKTTLIRIIAGLLAPDSGSVELGEAAAVGYLSQGFSLYGDLSIDENVRFFAELYGYRDFEARRTELLRLVGLDRFRSRRAGRLSGGMKKKLALACALIHSPVLLLLDEPTTGVDPVSRRELREILTQLQADGMSVLMSTPYFDEAERCDRIVLMHAGRVLRRGTPAEVIDSVTGTVLEVVCEPVRPARDVLRRQAGVEQVQLYGDRVHIRVSGDPDEQALQVAEVLGGEQISVASVRPIRATLQDVFVADLADAQRSLA